MTRRARRRQSGGGVPDWAWGLGLGVLAVIIVGGFFLMTEVLGGGGGGTCDQELPPLGSSEISQETFDTHVQSLTRVIDFLNAGDRAGAEASFYGETHSFTHNIDPPVRQQDEELAKRLCEAVLAVESSLVTSGSNASLALEMTTIRDLVQDSAVVLGYTRPES
jgi:hypothetical protein